MSLLFCTTAWSWLRKLVRGYCSAGRSFFIAPPNWNRFPMLAGPLMSVVYGMVDDDCVIDQIALLDGIFSSASWGLGWWCWLCIQGNDSNLLPCTSIRYLQGVLLISIMQSADSNIWTTTYEQGHDCSPWSSWIRSWDAVPSIWMMGMHHGFNKKTKLVFWFPMSDINC